MKPQELSDAMQFLDDSILAETAGALKKRALPPRPFALAAAAACICLAVLAFAFAPKGRLPASLPGTDGTGGAHGNGALPGESAPAPASAADSAGTAHGEDEQPSSFGPNDGASAREDLNPAYIASVLNEAIPARGEMDPSLPTLALDVESFTGSMGFEGYLAYDIAELENGGPWRLGDAVDTLPVYRNPLAREEGEAAQPDFDAMRTCLLELMARLGYSEAQFTVHDDTPDEARKEAIREKFAAIGEEVPDGYFAPTRLFAEAEGLQLELGADMTATFQWEPALALPEEYDLSAEASRGDVEAAGAYLLRQYRALLGYDAPEAALDGGDRNIYGAQRYELRFYDAAGSAAQRLENYWLEHWNFYGNDEPGKLWIARRWYSDRSQKLGDYPIVSPAEAWQLLQNGTYLTTVPEPAPENTLPARVDLLYRSESSAQVFMPYYRFLMELPDMERDGLKTYGAYYVPAVQSDYLNGLPVWDVRFN